ncbi:MAG: thermonuclease family protein [Patescibacteria group bacterium]
MAKKSKVPRRSLLVALGIPTVFFPGLFLAGVLGWNWQQGLDRLAKIGGYKQSEEIFPKVVEVAEVLDGDTFTGRDSLTVRLVGIDAINRGKDDYQEAKEYLEGLIDGEEVELEYDYYQDDKYGRILAYVWEDCSNSLGCQDGRRMINWVLLKKGYAKFVTYDKRRGLKHKDYLLSAGAEGVFMSECTDNPEGAPVITSISKTAGSVGDQLEIRGCNLAGFEGDLNLWIENSDGVRGLLRGEPGSTANLIKVVLGSPREDWPTLTPGVYKIYTDPWGKKSNLVDFMLISGTPRL